MPTKTDRRGHAREIGTKRCSMRTDRTDLATEATGRWSWSFKARHASGIQRNAVDLGYGAQWRELPKKYPPYQTCHRRFQQWVRRGKLEHICACWPWSCTPEGNWNTGTGRSFYRRLLHRGQKRGLAVEPPGAARARRSSLSPMVTVFLSPLMIAPHRGERRQLTPGRPPLGAIPQTLASGTTPGFITFVGL
jgi:hypothetical protein